MGNAVECGKELEIIFDITKEDACCQLECELPLRWGLPCRHWMCPAFVDETPILLSLIHPRWLFDGPDYLETLWHMSYLTGSNSKNNNASTRARQTQTSLEPEILQEITEAEYEKNAGDQYQNHDQNLMLSTALQAVEKQKEFTGATAKAFARVFTTQKSKLIEAVKAREERHTVLPPQLPPLLKEPKLRSFPNKYGESRKMTGTKAAVAAEADRTRASRKAKKEQDIREKYEAELAALRTDSSSPHLEPFSSPFSGKAPGLSKSRSPPRDTNLSSPIHVASSDSDSEVEDVSFDLAPKLPSLTPRQSGRTRKPIKKLESQKRRKIEDQSKPKRQKVRKSKIDVTSQLKEYLGSDIELYM